MTPLVVALAGMGALAIYAAIKDMNPVDVVKNALQGKPPPGEGSWAPIGSQIGLGITAGTTGGQSFIWPTSSRSTTEQYGATGSWWENYHDGLDIDGACGDAIWAPVAGVVKSTGWAGAYGNRLIIKAFGYKDLEVHMCHMNSISVRPGKVVDQRDPVGTMGQTGNASGCHIHFMVVINGDDVDPAPYLAPGGSSGVGIEAGQ